MDLHPRAVQLGLENRRAAEAFERLGDAGRGLRQHRADRPADLQRELGERRGAAGQRGGGDGGQVAAQHRRAPDRRRAGRPAAFATASAITPASAPWRSSPPSRRRRKVCSASVAAANNPLTQLGAPRLRALARRPRRSR